MIDMQMPEIGGLALAGTIKTDPALAATKLIMLMPFGQNLKLESGMDDYLSKPTRTNEISAVLERALSLPKT
jgi:two-component system sensor histidine kinase/response regulator